MPLCGPSGRLVLASDSLRGRPPRSDSFLTGTEAVSGGADGGGGGGGGTSAASCAGSDAGLDAGGLSSAIGESFPSTKHGSVGESIANSGSLGRRGGGISIVVCFSMSVLSDSAILRVSSSFGGGLDLELAVRSEKSSDSYEDAESIDARLRSTSDGLRAIEANGTGSFERIVSIGSGEACLGMSNPKLNCISAASGGLVAVLDINLEDSPRSVSTGGKSGEL